MFKISLYIFEYCFIHYKRTTQFMYVLYILFFRRRSALYYFLYSYFSFSGFRTYLPIQNNVIKYLFCVNSYLTHTMLFIVIMKHVQ